jgi:hypothetical protein
MRKGKVRQFATGATRDTDTGKYDYAGFLSPLVLQHYAAYMYKHRFQADRTLRASDNWKKGMPELEYLKSAIRHMMDVWLQYEEVPSNCDVQDSLCAVLFNVMGILHERSKVRHLVAARLEGPK